MTKNHVAKMVPVLLLLFLAGCMSTGYNDVNRQGEPNEPGNQYEVPIYANPPANQP